MKLHIFVIFHKTLYENFYGMPSTMLKNYITFVAVNDKKAKTVPPFATYNTMLECQLSPDWTNRLQEEMYHESSVLINLGKSHLLQTLDYTGCIHYDMSITENTIFAIQHMIDAFPQMGCCFYFKSQAVDINVCNSFFSPQDGWETWSNIIKLYNNTFNTDHKIERIMNKEIPMFHTFIIPTKILKPLAAFVEKVAPTILDYLGGVRHFPYHLERLWGICLLLKKLEGELPIWIPLIDMVHDEGVKEPKFHA